MTGELSKARTSGRGLVVGRATRRLSHVVAAAAVVAAPVSALAGVSTYTGPGGTTATPTTGTFNAPANWSPAGVPPAADPTTELDFNNSGANTYTATNDLGTIALNILALNSTSTGTVTIDATGGGAFNFVSNGATTPTLTQAGSGAVTVSVPLTLTNNLAIGGAGTGTVTLGGVLSSTGTLTKSGSFTLNLTAANTYTGLTTVRQGTVDLNSATGPAIAGDLTLTPLTATSGGITVKLLASNQIAAASNVVLNTTSGVANGTTQLDLNGFDNTIGSLTFAPQTSGQVVTVSTGTGTLTLGGNINVNGNSTNPLTISGKLNLGGATRTIGGTNPGVSGVRPTLTISAAVANGGINQTYAGPVVLSGANTYAGTTTVANGSLSVSVLGNEGEASSSLGAPTGANRTITLGGTGGTNGTLVYTGGTTSTDRPLALDAAAGGSNVLANNGTGTLTWTGPLSGPHTISLSGTGTGVYSGLISVTAGTVRKGGTGTWSFTNTGNTFTNLAVDQGTLSVAAVNNASTNGVLGNSAAAVAISTTTSTGTFQYTGATATTSRPFSMAGNVANPGRFDVATAATALTLSGAVGGTGSLAKLGAGTLVLSNNTYTGDTTVLAGTLTLGQPNLGDASLVTVNSGSVLNLNFGSGSVTDTIGTLTLNGVVQPPGLYNASNAAPFITGTGNLLATVPEPSAVGLAAVVAGGLLARRRRRRA